MPQYFGPRWTAAARIVLIGGPLLLVTAGVSAALVVRSPGWTGVRTPVEQPIPFTHTTHAGQLGLDCRYCHASVDRARFAGIPATEVCMNCHTHVWTGLPAIQPVRASYETNIPIAWKRVHNLPDYSFFDHAIHVKKGVGCVSCHGRVDQMAQVWQTETLHMEWCLECHRYPERYVQPKETVYDLSWRPPADRAGLEDLGRRLGLDPVPTTREELGTALVEKYGIHRDTSCSKCHH